MVHDSQLATSPAPALKPASTPRARRRDANVARILEAAMSLVAAEGLEGLSMIRLAAAVDYTPGALYRYIESKDALLSQMVIRVLEQVREMLSAAVGLLPPSASPLAQVFALAQGYRAFSRLEPHRFGLLSMTLAAPGALIEAPSDAASVVAVMLGAMRPLAEALAAAASAGLLSKGDAAERMLCAFASLQGALQLGKQARYAPALIDVERLATRVLRSLLVGWGGNPRTVDSAITRVALLGDLTDRLGGSRS